MFLFYIPNIKTVVEDFFFNLGFLRGGFINQRSTLHRGKHNSAGKNGRAKLYGLLNEL